MVRHKSLDEEAVRPTLYSSLEPRATGTVFAALQADTDPLATVGAVRAAVREIDPRLPIDDVRTLDARRRRLRGRGVRRRPPGT